MNAVAEYAGGDPSGEPRTLSEFLQEVSLVADVDRLSDDENRVTLMTLHASKGLEFKVVFVTGLEEACSRSPRRPRTRRSWRRSGGFCTSA